MGETPNKPYNNPQWQDRAERARAIPQLGKQFDERLLQNAIQLSYGQEFE
jgi:hypothetical protein